MKNLKQAIKEKFDYDVTALPAYVDEQSMEVWADLIYESGFTSRINVMENVKGSETIKLINGDIALQSAENCTHVPDGSVVFNGKNLVTKRIYAGQKFCNEQLVGSWGQLLLSMGASRQDKDLPFEDVILAYLVMLIKKKNQDLIFLGDTGSLNPDLAHYDGLVKLLDADVNVISATTAETAITDANAYTLAKLVHDAIPAILFSKGVNVEIIVGRETAQKIRNQVWNTKDYSAVTNFAEDKDGISFILPNTNITVRSYPQLDGTQKMYAIPYNYVFFGTDLESDYDGIELRYSEEQKSLIAESLFRSGINYIYSEYFVKLTLTVV